MTIDDLKLALMETCGSQSRGRLQRLQSGDERNREARSAST